MTSFSEKKITLKLIDNILSFLKEENEKSSSEYSFFTVSFIDPIFSLFQRLCNSNYLVIKSKLSVSDVKILFILLNCLIDNDFTIFYEYEISQNLKEKYQKENDLSDDEIDELYQQLVEYSDVNLWIKYLKSYSIDIKKHLQEIPKNDGEIDDVFQKFNKKIKDETYEKIEYFIVNRKKIFETVIFKGDTYVKTRVTYKEDSMRFKKDSSYSMYLSPLNNGNCKILVFFDSDDYNIDKNSMITYNDSNNCVPHISAESISVFLEKYNEGNNEFDGEEGEFESYEVPLDDWLDGVYYLEYHFSSIDCGLTTLEMNVSKFFKKYSNQIDPNLVKTIPKSLLKETYFNG